MSTKSHYLRCRQNRKGCTGRMVSNLATGKVTITNAHTCSDSTTDIELLQVKQDIKTASKQTPGRLRDIFNSHMSSNNLGGKASFVGLESTMQRCRRSTLPGLPHSASQAVTMLCQDAENVPDRYTMHVQSTYEGPDGSAIVLWCQRTSEMIKLEQELATSTGLFADATFSITPMKQTEKESKPLSQMRMP